MKKMLVGGLLFFLACGILLSAGCAQKPTPTVTEAIEKANVLPTVPERINYLVGQAQSFLNSKEYQKVIETCQYVLTKLDSNQQAAKDLIEKAKAQLQATAQKAVGDVSNKLLGGTSK